MLTRKQAVGREREREWSRRKKKRQNGSPPLRFSLEEEAKKGLSTGFILFLSFPYFYLVKPFLSLAPFALAPPLRPFAFNKPLPVLSPWAWPSATFFPSSSSFHRSSNLLRMGSFLLKLVLIQFPCDSERVMSSCQNEKQAHAKDSWGTSTASGKKEVQLILSFFPTSAFSLPVSYEKHCVLLCVFEDIASFRFSFSALVVTQQRAVSERSSREVGTL